MTWGKLEMILVSPCETIEHPFSLISARTNDVLYVIQRRFGREYVRPKQHDHGYTTRATQIQRSTNRYFVDMFECSGVECMNAQRTPGGGASGITWGVNQGSFSTTRE